MKLFTSSIRNFLFGDPLNPSAPGVKKRTYLVAFLARVGLGADGLSSACYGPEAAFLALQQNNFLVIYLAIAITLTVFIIAMSYNQVIELFPSGGGGYKIATHLLGPIPGLISGGALIVDYVLTITISIASGVDALFSLLPVTAQHYKLSTEICWLHNHTGNIIQQKLQTLGLYTMLMPIRLPYTDNYSLSNN